MWFVLCILIPIKFVEEYVLTIGYLINCTPSNVLTTTNGCA